MFSKFLSYFLFLFFSVICSVLAKENSNIIIDAHLTFQEAIKGTQAPKEVIDSLVLIDVEYFSFDKKLHRGQILIRKNLENDVQHIFQLIKESKFPIKKVVPIVQYNWSDDSSMADNNTSSFNYRKVANKNKLSNHSFGTAIDINPVQNPAVYSDSTISPKGAKYSPLVKGTITEDCFLTKEFKKLGWIWGGNWKSLKDYQHFEKTKN